MAKNNIRKRRCPCGQYFQPKNSFHVACCLEGSLKVAERARKRLEAKQAKVQRQQAKIRKERLKTRREWISEAQGAFNAYIRERDKDKTCICCGAVLGKGAVGGGFDCGHYRSVGSAPHLRFDERNAHGQTKRCNRYGAGRAVDYRIGLIERIGQEAVEQLEAENLPAKWSIDELKAIKAHYKLKLKELKNTPQ